MAKCRQHDGNLFVVTLIFPLECFELSNEIRIGGEQLAKPHECAHDVNTHFNRAFAVEDICSLDGSMFGECPRGFSMPASTGL